MQEMLIGGERRGSIAIARAWWTFRHWPIIPALIVAVLIGCGIGAPWLAPHDPFESDLSARFAPPVWMDEGSSRFLLGADQFGRDVLSRIIHGARISLTVSGITLVVGIFIGTTLGLFSGYLGGWTDEVLMRLVDVKFSIPLILVALVMVVAVGQSFPLLVGILAFWIWGRFARQARGETLILKRTDYVALARVSGASTLHILVKHILPGLINTIVVLATWQVGLIIMVEATLSFLGVGIPPPTPSWGSMVSDGRSYLARAWWVSLFPGMGIFLTVLSLNFLGDWLRDWLDPRLRQI